MRLLIEQKKKKKEHNKAYNNKKKKKVKIPCQMYNCLWVVERKLWLQQPEQ